jgi:hypothetical protein
MSIQAGVLGTVIGGFCGFLIRDEYYFPSYKRAEDLTKEFYTNDKLVDQEIEALQ